MDVQELNQNFNLVSETNYSLCPDDVDVWGGELPFKTGMAFPTSEIKDRADHAKTSHLLFDNKTDEILDLILNIVPEQQLLTTYQIREIVMSLPYFGNITKSWVGLLGDFPIIDCSVDEFDNIISDIVETSNMRDMFTTEIKRRFTDQIGAYKVDLDVHGNVSIQSIGVKNIAGIYVNPDNVEEVQVVVIFSIYSSSEGDKVDFVEFHNTGKIVKSTFNYNGGSLGECVGVTESVAFNGEYEESPIVLFTHNVLDGFFGVCQFENWLPSITAVMRSFQNILRLGERSREIIRKVPESALTKDQGTGSYYYYNQGVISYNSDSTEGKGPDVEYVTPELHIQEMSELIQRVVAQVGTDSQLGSVFFNLESLGSRLSGDSLRAALFPARVEASRIAKEMTTPMKQIIRKACLAKGYDLGLSKLSIKFQDGFPENRYDTVKAVQVRLNSERPSISLEDAIVELDRVPVSVARQRAEKIKEEMGLVDPESLSFIEDDIKEDITDDQLLENRSTSDISIGSSKTGNAAPSKSKRDDAVWGEMLPIWYRDSFEYGIKGLKDKRGKRYVVYLRKRKREN